MSQINQLPFLTVEEIDDLLGSTRERGGYARFLNKFAESGDVYIDVRSDASFAKKDTAAIFNSMAQNAKKLMQASEDFPRLRVVKTKDDATVIVVNVDVFEASKAVEVEDES